MVMEHCSTDAVKADMSLKKYAVIYSTSRELLLAVQPNLAPFVNEGKESKSLLSKTLTKRPCWICHRKYNYELNHRLMNG